jgi:hypothetical protein
MCEAVSAYSDRGCAFPRQPSFGSSRHVWEGMKIPELYCS